MKKLLAIVALLVACGSVFATGFLDVGDDQVGTIFAVGADYVLRDAGYVYLEKGQGDQAKYKKILTDEITADIGWQDGRIYWTAKTIGDVEIIVVLYDPIGPDGFNNDKLKGFIYARPKVKG
jgi:hypothetical protein